MTFESCKDDIEDNIIQETPVVVDACINPVSNDTIFFGNDVLLTSCSNPDLNHFWLINDSVVSERESFSFKPQSGIESYQITLKIDSLGFSGETTISIQPNDLSKMETLSIPLNGRISTVRYFRKVFKSNEGEYYVDYGEYTSFSEDNIPLKNRLVKLNKDIEIEFDVINLSDRWNSGRSNFISSINDEVRYSKIVYGGNGDYTDFFKFNELSSEFSNIQRSNHVLFHRAISNDSIFWSGYFETGQGFQQSYVLTNKDLTILNEQYIQDSEQSICYGIFTFGDQILSLTLHESGKVLLNKIDKNLQVISQSEIKALQGNFDFEADYLMGKNWTIKALENDRLMI
ncbi:MAG: hypothetical protein R3321_09910, partial [Nitrososphaeraceae archaeon]|nr:hypothetical protein [Nitrososphaeraceae archaeon]